MAGVAGENIVDLVRSTLRDLGKGSWVNLATDLQRLVAMREFLKKHHVKFGSGEGMTWTVVTDDNDAARNVGLYATDVVNRSDAIVRPTVPWRHTTTNWALDRREISMNKTPARIVELVKVEKWRSMMAMAQLMETDFWSCPADSTDDTTPYGIRYWCYTQEESTTGSYTGGTFDSTGIGGFLNVNKTGFTSGPGGVSAVTYPRWANWNNQYVDVTKADLITRMRRGAFNTEWLSAVDHPDYELGKGGRAIYSGYETMAEVERLLEAQNDSLGNDIASKDGKVKFKGNPWVAVPQLDNSDASNDPVYQFDWDVFYLACLEDEYMVTTEIEHSPNQHTVMAMHTDLSWNTRCENRRRLAVYSK